MRDLLQRASETASFIKERIQNRPKIGIILGSGLGSLADEIHEERIEIPYSEIPNFPTSEVVGHKNKLIMGKIYGKDVVVMQGRFHYYEGYDMDEVTFPIRVFALLGVEELIVTNAAGGINKSFKPQDLMIIKDHINICGVSPLRGSNEEVFGERFPSMTNAYSNRLIELVKEVALLKGFDKKLLKKVSDSIIDVPEEFYDFSYESESEKSADKKFMKKSNDLVIDIQEGVYAFMPGPQYETSAEIKMLGMLGADAVGMSTVPEVIVARHMGMEVLGISCITNVTGNSEAPSHKEVVENATAVEEKFKNLVMRLLMKM